MGSFQPVTISHKPGENEAATITLRRWYDVEEEDAKLMEYLPPGLTPEMWANVLGAFTEALGAEKVVTGKELRVNYMDPFSMNADEKERRGSACALRPSTVEEIQAILRVASANQVPLWTVSRGRNLGYGGPAARVKVSGDGFSLHLAQAPTLNPLIFAGISDCGPSEHEQGSRDQRQVLVLYGGTWCQLLPDLPGNSGAKEENLVLDAGFGLGESRGKCT